MAAAQVMITKYASAAHLSTIITARIVIVWIYSCIAGLETFLPLQIIGFIILVSGILVYNEILVVPISYMSDHIYKKREIKSKI